MLKIGGSPSRAPALAWLPLATVAETRPFLFLPSCAILRRRRACDAIDATVGGKFSDGATTIKATVSDVGVSVDQTNTITSK